MNWLNNYDDMSNDNEISKLNLELSLHYVIYIIQLLSPLIVFTFNDDGFLIEKNINIGMISIESKEFQYILQFDTINDINNEMISQKKNLDDLNKKIINEYKELSIEIHNHIKKNFKRQYQYEFKEIADYRTKEYKKFINKYFENYNNIRMSHNGFNIDEVFREYYVNKYDKKMNKYIKMIDEINKISKNNKKILNDIHNYLECKYNQL
jgi:hypothetical protein